MEQLEMYVSSGLPIVKALSVIGERMPRRQREPLERAGKAIESGQLLSASLLREIKLPPAIVGLIASGESSGNLAETLRSGHALLAREDELFKKCSGAMVYPLVIGLATAALTIGLVRGIMPQIIPLLSSLHSNLPIMTRIVLSASSALTAYGLYGAVGSLLAGIVFAGAYRKILSLRGFIHLCAARIPVVGGVLTDYHLALFFQSLGASVESGIPLDAAFDRTAATISLLPLRRKLGALTPAIGRGEAVSRLCARVMPPYVTALIAAGEASGNLGGVFLRVAGLIDRELDHLLKRLTALIEPLMMIGMGMIVGSIALSIMMPIYDISKAIQR